MACEILICVILVLILLSCSKEYFCDRCDITFNKLNNDGTTGIINNKQYKADLEDRQPFEVPLKISSPEFKPEDLKHLNVGTFYSRRAMRQGDHAKNRPKGNLEDDSSESFRANKKYATTRTSPLSMIFKHDN